jgi:hypothetical protein
MEQARNILAESLGLELTLEFDDESLRIESIPGEGDMGVVAFTGIGFKLGAFQRAEFVGTASGGGLRPALFITDKNKTWFNAPGLFERTVDTVREHFARAGVREIVSLGNSMGGFGACLFAAPMGASRCIAFSPQWAVRKDLMPRETRWGDYIAAIGHHRFETAFDTLDPKVRYWLCSGIVGVDIEHVRKFPARPNVTHVLVPGFEHNLTHYFKQIGVLTPLVGSLLADDHDAVNHLLRRIGAFVQNAEQGPPQ